MIGMMVHLNTMGYVHFKLLERDESKEAITQKSKQKLIGVYFKPLAAFQQQDKRTKSGN